MNKNYVYVAASIIVLSNTAYGMHSVVCGKQLGPELVQAAQEKDEKKFNKLLPLFKCWLPGSEYDEGRRSLLEIVASGGKLAMLKTLVAHWCGDDAEEIKKFVNSSSCNTEQKKPLHFAAQHGHENVVKFLVAFGAQIDVVDGKGNTPVELVKNNPKLQLYLRKNKASGQEGRTCKRLRVPAAT